MTVLLGMCYTKVEKMINNARIGRILVPTKNATQ